MQVPLNQTHPDKPALVEDARSYTYAELDDLINQVAKGLLAGKSDLEEERIAFLMPASLGYVAMLHGIWRAGASRYRSTRRLPLQNLNTA